MNVGTVGKSVAEVELEEETPVPLTVGKDRVEVNNGPDVVSVDNHGTNRESEDTCQ